MEAVERGVLPGRPLPLRPCRKCADAGLLFTAFTSPTRKGGLVAVTCRAANEDDITGELLQRLKRHAGGDAGAIGGDLRKFNSGCDADRVKELERSVARMMSRKFAAQVASLVLMRCAWKSKGHAPSLDEPQADGAFLSAVNEHLADLVAMWTDRFGIQCLLPAREIDPRMLPAPPPQSTRHPLFVESEEALREQIARPRRPGHANSVGRSAAVVPTDSDEDWDALVRESDLREAKRRALVQMPSTSDSLSDDDDVYDFATVEDMRREANIRMHLRRLGRGEPVATIDELPAFRHIALEADNLSISIGEERRLEAEHVHHSAESAPVAAAATGSQGTDTPVSLLRTPSQSAAIDAEPSALPQSGVTSGLLGVLVQGVKLQYRPATAPPPPPPPRSARWLGGSDSTPSSLRTRGSPDALHQQALAARTKGPSFLEPGVAAVELPTNRRLSQSLAMREVLAARTTAGWRHFVDCAEDSDQRARRVHMVVAALNSHPEEYVEGNLWSMGPFYHDLGKEGLLALS